MKINNQKKIAREFIFFIICISISIISFFCIYPYNYITQKQCLNIKKEIESKKIIRNRIIRLNQVKREKQISYSKSIIKDVFKEDYEERDNSIIWQMNYSVIRNDSIRYYWEKLWIKEVIDFNKKMGYENPEKFSIFILSNMIKKDDLILINKINYEIETLNTKKINKYESFIELESQTKISLYIFLISLIVLFILRYLVYGTLWSLKILKNQNK